MYESGLSSRFDRVIDDSLTNRGLAESAFLSPRTETLSGFSYTSNKENSLQTDRYSSKTVRPGVEI